MSDHPYNYASLCFPRWYRHKMVSIHPGSTRSKHNLWAVFLLRSTQTCCFSRNSNLRRWLAYNVICTNNYTPIQNPAFHFNYYVVQIGTSYQLPGTCYQRNTSTWYVGRSRTRSVDLLIKPRINFSSYYRLYFFTVRPPRAYIGTTPMCWGVSGVDLARMLSIVPLVSPSTAEYIHQLQQNWIKYWLFVCWKKTNDRECLQLVLYVGKKIMTRNVYNFPEICIAFVVSCVDWPCLTESKTMKSRSTLYL